MVATSSALNFSAMLSTKMFSTAMRICCILVVIALTGAAADEFMTKRVGVLDKGGDKATVEAGMIL